MKTVKFGVLLMIAGVFTVALDSCKKYDDGGLIGKAEKRLTANQWKLDKYFGNGNDETTDLLISKFIETFSDGGTLSRTYTDKTVSKLVSLDHGVWMMRIKILKLMELVA